MARQMHSPAFKSARRAFTLVELMVVLLILGIVIAILLPALGGVRNAARVASTKSQLTQLKTASEAFAVSERRSPGYFTQAQMGSAENAAANRGFSGLKNVLLDLSGGITQQAANPGAGIHANVGPMNDATKNVTVDVNLIGAASKGAGVGGKAYYTPDGNFVVHNAAGQQEAGDENKLIPDVVDAFGQPILAWVMDDRAPTAFASENSATPAKFYWNSNRAFLAAMSVGKLATNQRYDGPDSPGSMIGSNGNSGPGSRAIGDTGTTGLSGGLEALLGNPAYPQPVPNQTRPAEARGKIIFHSAGRDGYYMGTFDRGGKAAVGTGNTVRYRPDTDMMGDFDDITVSGGN